MVSSSCTFQPSGNFTGEGDRVVPVWGHDRNRSVEGVRIRDAPNKKKKKKKKKEKLSYGCGDPERLVLHPLVAD
ncbi:hypothetical protein VN97_g1035 [Penicillium thymicola]|uniref:Uncharacterized protein n=1 Tax=Penicillium thymicola TaxID=293382 RepID=A0AAI9TRN6_PENTH|nr:hypothetical protein VN97_g1035 [Penicillium thymicola]